MEELKKQQILSTAKDVFKEKGYAAASMQEIAEACGMAKGSIYKIFPSKEDLYTEVFVACHQTMFEQAGKLEHALRQEGLLPKEQICRKIEFQLQYMIENYYFMFEFKELPIKNNEKFIEAWKKKRMTLLAWHRDIFLDAYGDRIKDYIWDVVAMFRGLLREYLSYVMQKVISLPMSELAKFFVERLDAVVSDMTRTKPRPVLIENNAYFHHLNPSDSQTRHETVNDFLQFVAGKIEELQRPEKIRRELLEVVGLLQQELAREAPNSTMIRVCQSYLETIHELRQYVRQLTFMMEEK